MKKFITLCLFVFALLAGTQTAMAQDAKINEKAYNKTKELHQSLKFNNDAFEQVYVAYQEFLAKTNTLETTHQPGSELYVKYSKMVKERLLKQMQVALNEDLYNRYLIITDQEEEK